MRNLKISKAVNHSEIVYSRVKKQEGLQAINDVFSVPAAVLMNEFSISLLNKYSEIASVLTD